MTAVDVVFDIAVVAVEVHSGDVAAIVEILIDYDVVDDVVVAAVVAGAVVVDSVVAAVDVDALVDAAVAVDVAVMSVVQSYAVDFAEINVHFDEIAVAVVVIEHY